MRVVRDASFEEFFNKRLPDEGFTLDELYDGYFGLIHEQRAQSPELHGYAIGLGGEVVIPQLRPEVPDEQPQSTHA